MVFKDTSCHMVYLAIRKILSLWGHCEDTRYCYSGDIRDTFYLSLIITNQTDTVILRTWDTAILGTVHLKLSLLAFQKLLWGHTRHFHSENIRCNLLVIYCIVHVQIRSFRIRLKDSIYSGTVLFYWVVLDIIRERGMPALISFPDFPLWIS